MTTVSAAMQRCTLAHHKIRYPSKLMAKLSLMNCQIKADQGIDRRQENRIYWCKTCKGYHLTSQPKE